MSKTNQTSTNMIAIVSGKGGTGKSIIATSLGYILAHCGFKVLLVDTDLFTGGLSFYCLASKPRRGGMGLQDLLLKGDSVDLEPVLISSDFTNANLRIIPAISRSRPKAPELKLSTSFNDLSVLASTFRGVIERAQEQFEFDFVLIDTRGGSDLTSVAAAVAAGSFFIVTEADKTSWDVGEIVLDSIEEAARATFVDVHRLGFVLNKNVLPEDAIVAFLRRQWDCPHLATIPLDPLAIRAFQEDKVPIVENVGSPFSVAVLGLVEKLFSPQEWSPERRYSLLALQADSQKEVRKKEWVERRVQLMSGALKLYAFVLVGILLWLQRKGDNFAQYLTLGVFALITLSDRMVLKLLTSSLTLFTHRPTKSTED